MINEPYQEPPHPKPNTLTCEERFPNWPNARERLKQLIDDAFSNKKGWVEVTCGFPDLASFNVSLNANTPFHGAVSSTIDPIMNETLTHWLSNDLDKLYNLAQDRPMSKNLCREMEKWLQALEEKRSQQGNLYSLKYHLLTAFGIYKRDLGQLVQKYGLSEETNWFMKFRIEDLDAKYHDRDVILFHIENRLTALAQLEDTTVDMDQSVKYMLNALKERSEQPNKSLDEVLSAQ